MENVKNFYFITPHAVTSYKQKTGSTTKQAIEDILEMMQEAVLTEIGNNGSIFYGKIRGEGFCAVVCPGEGKYPAIKTILSAGSYEAQRARRRIRDAKK